MLLGTDMQWQFNGQHYKDKKAYLVLSYDLLHTHTLTFYQIREFKGREKQFVDQAFKPESSQSFSFELKNVWLNKA